MKTFLFPGQGSQSKGMGEALFDEFKDIVDNADKILGYSIKELCLDDPRKELSQTQFTQPALYVVNALSYFKKIKETGQKPDFAIGHSLGEFNALLAAECFSFESGLKLVKKRGELMSQASGGGMAAILNSTKEEIEAILAESGLTNIDLANYNTPSQIVISGLKEEIAKAQSFFQKGDMLYYPLNTSGAFHSRFMQPSREKFERYLQRFKLSKLKIPVISNISARPYENGDVIANLSNQITNSVKWSESIQYLMELGEMEFEEIGHGDVLTKLVQKIREESKSSEEVIDDAQDSVVGDDKVLTKPVQKKTKSSKSVQKKSKSSKPVQKKQKKEPPVPSEEVIDEVQDKGIKKTAIIEEQKIETSQQDTTEVTAEEKVNAWNKRYPIGTKVKSSFVDYEDLETKTEAVVLFGHRAAVYMKGYNGYFDLDETTALT